MIAHFRNNRKLLLVCVSLSTLALCFVMAGCGCLRTVRKVERDPLTGGETVKYKDRSELCEAAEVVVGSLAIAFWGVTKFLSFFTPPEPKDDERKRLEKEHDKAVRALDERR